MAEPAEPGTFLALLADADRDALLQLGDTSGSARGERLIHHGEPGERVLVLLDGHVKASNSDSRGRELVLSFRGPGDVLGELTFIHAEPCSSNVTAIESVAAQALAASVFRGYLERTPTAALTLIDGISRRFRDANRKRVQFSDLDTVGRVAARLVELCERYGDRTNAGIEIKLSPSRQTTSEAGRLLRAPVSPARCEHCETWAGSPPSVGTSRWSTSASSCDVPSEPACEPTASQARSC